jgi:hypothetical protein
MGRGRMVTIDFVTIATGWRLRFAARSQGHAATTALAGIWSF